MQICILLLLMGELRMNGRLCKTVSYTNVHTYIHIYIYTYMYSILLDDVVIMKRSVEHGLRIDTQVAQNLFLSFSTRYCSSGI